MFENGSEYQALGRSQRLVSFEGQGMEECGEVEYWLPSKTTVELKEFVVLSEQVMRLTVGGGDEFR